MRINDNYEEVFLKNYDSSIFEKLSVTVDVLVYTIYESELKILLLKRKETPYQGMLSLPGTFVAVNETLDEAAGRVLKEKARLSGIYLEQLYTWGDTKRDPRMRIISVSYIALVSIEKLRQMFSGKEIEKSLYAVDMFLKEEKELAFDHLEMIKYGRERIQNKADYTEIAFEFLEKKFTLPQLQKIYEILLNKKLYKANFRKKMQDMVVETKEQTSGEAHRPSKLYQRG